MGRKIARGQTLVLASHNTGKLREIEALVRPLGIAVVSAGALGLAEPVEDAPDFAGNARIKAVAAATASGLPALSDDSGFCVAALDGAPGVLSARWAGPSKDFGVAALCLAWPDGHTETFLGRIDGLVVWPPRGDKGFGYDPMFVPAGAAQTFGEMDPEAKHAVSHRALAFAQVLAACLG